MTTATAPNVRKGATWPAVVALLGAVRAEGSPDWVEGSEEDHDYLLGCLPPIWLWSGAFMCSEPAAHTREGEPIYTGAIQLRGRYFFRDSTVRGFYNSLAALRQRLEAGEV